MPALAAWLPSAPPLCALAVAIPTQVAMLAVERSLRRAYDARVPLIGLVTLPFWQPFAAKLLRPPPGVEKKTDTILSASRMTRTAEMLEVDFIQSREGNKEWQIKAGRVYSLDGEKIVKLEDIEAVFFGDPGNDSVQTIISSRWARYDADTKLLNLQDQVVINDDRGYEIQTDSLHYLGQKKIIQSGSKVLITGTNIAVSGENLMYDVESGDYRLEGNVVCKVW